MVSQSVKSYDSHPIELLPLYVNRTLSETERQRIEEHITLCPSCQHELSGLEELASTVKGEEVITPDLHFAWLKMKKKITDPKQELSYQKKKRFSFTKWLSPSFAWGLVALQSIILIGFVVYMLTSRSEGDIWRTLGGQSTVIKKEEVRLKIIFKEGAKASAIAGILFKVEGQIVSGPSSQGVFEVSIPVDIAKQKGVNSILETFREQNDTVKWVQIDEK